MSSDEKQAVESGQSFEDALKAVPEERLRELASFLMRAHMNSTQEQLRILQSLVAAMEGSAAVRKPLLPIVKEMANNVSKAGSDMTKAIAIAEGKNG
jgi:hypothetical protein